MTAAVEFRGVGFRYAARGGREAGFAIEDLSFAVEAGEIFGIVGPNASGKTTVIRLVSKVLAPARGDILLGGESVRRLARAAVARRVALVPQGVPLGFPHTVEELVLMGRFPHGPGRFFETAEDRRHAREAMEATGVLGLRGAALDDLSAGERQRVMLARALCQAAPLLVLDEPTAHLDLRYQAEFVGLLRRFNRRAGLTVVLISHDLSLAAEVCGRLLLLRAGAAAAVGPVETVLDEATLQAVYGCRVVVDKHPASRRPTVQVVWPDD
ncbi:MAG TPA: ABC transporter ATP-binding protein [Methylomirabilota bacterium]|jgi:iron complex transport system ATP-binding protein|nr:ABC transporter ATP-binding protein [Methylomirabilota bacterium]